MGSILSSSSSSNNTMSGGGGVEEVRSNVDALIRDNKIIMFSKAYCPYCVKAKGALEKLGVSFKVVDLVGHSEAGLVQDYLNELTGGRTVPRVFVNGRFIGGGDDTVKMVKSGELRKLIDE